MEQLTPRIPASFSRRGSLKRPLTRLISFFINNITSIIENIMGIIDSNPGLSPYALLMQIYEARRLTGDKTLYSAIPSA